MRLDYAAISDVGRVRKDNQDSGYAGPRLLAVCDGVGGAARGDIASAPRSGSCAGSTTPTARSSDLLGQVAGALHRAHDRIGELVDEDPALTGTSTTATVALFDGATLGMGHVGDSRAYLLRDGELQPAHQGPHVRADADRRRPDHRGGVAGPPPPQPDPQGDRRHPRPRARPVRGRDPRRRPALLCSDGACGVLDDRAGSPTSSAPATPTTPPSSWSGPASRPAAPTTSPAWSPTSSTTDADGRRRADAGRRRRRAAAARRPRHGRRRQPVPRPPLRRHRRARAGARPTSPTTSAFAITTDPIDPEEARYAPRPPRRFAWLRAAAGAGRPGRLLWIAGRRRVVLDPAAVLRRRARRRRSPSTAASTPTCPASSSRSRTRPATSRSTDLSDYDADQVRDGIGARRPRRRPSYRRQPGRRAGPASDRPATSSDAPARPAAGGPDMSQTGSPHGVRAPPPPGRRAVPARPRARRRHRRLRRRRPRRRGHGPGRHHRLRRLAGRARHRAPTSSSGSPRRTPTRCCCPSSPRSTGSAWR